MDYEWTMISCQQLFCTIKKSRVSSQVSLIWMSGFLTLEDPQRNSPILWCLKVVGTNKWTKWKVPLVPPFRSMLSIHIPSRSKTASTDLRAAREDTSTSNLHMDLHVWVLRCRDWVIYRTETLWVDPSQYWAIFGEKNGVMC